MSLTDLQWRGKERNDLKQKVYMTCNAMSSKLMTLLKPAQGPLDSQSLGLAKLVYLSIDGFRVVLGT